MSRGDSGDSAKRVSSALDCARASFPLDEFSHKDLAEVMEWLEQSDNHALILAGDGNLGKTNLAEALLISKCPAGFWFLDDCPREAHQLCSP